MPAVTLVSAVPRHISPEEHRTLTGTTPASFSDIPPVLRHTEQNVSVTFDPPVNEFSSEETSKGTLYVIESALVFMSAAGQGFQIEYPAITLHAISRAETGPFIYCQLDEQPHGEAAQASEEDVSEMRELNIKPQNPASLEPIFESLSLCASLHPDPNMSDDDMEDDAFMDASGFEVFSGTEGEELSEVGRAALAHLESIIYDPHEHLAEQEEEHAPAPANGVNTATEEGQFSDIEEPKPAS